MITASNHTKGVKSGNPATVGLLPLSCKILKRCLVKGLEERSGVKQKPRVSSGQAVCPSCQEKPLKDELPNLKKRPKEVPARVDALGFYCGHVHELV